MSACAVHRAWGMRECSNDQHRLQHPRGHIALFERRETAGHQSLWSRLAPSACESRLTDQSAPRSRHHPALRMPVVAFLPGSHSVARLTAGVGAESGVAAAGGKGVVAAGALLPTGLLGCGTASGQDKPPLLYYHSHARPCPCKAMCTQTPAWSDGLPAVLEAQLLQAGGPSPFGCPTGRGNLPKRLAENAAPRHRVLSCWGKWRVESNADLRCDPYREVLEIEANDDCDGSLSRCIAG